MAVPIKLAIATWRIEEVCPSRSPPNPSTGTSSARLGPIPPALLSPLRNEYYSHHDPRRNPRYAASGLLCEQGSTPLRFLAHERHGDRDAARHDPDGAEERQPEAFDERGIGWHRFGESLRAGSGEGDQDREAKHRPDLGRGVQKARRESLQPAVRRRD